MLTLPHSVPVVVLIRLQENARATRRSAPSGVDLQRSLPDENARPDLFTPPGFRTKIGDSIPMRDGARIAHADARRSRRIR
jgi:hypothetical protein